MSDKTFPATIIRILDPYKVVINKGSREGIKVGQRFLIYAETDELLQDPVTLEGLGNLEIARGTGKAVYVQEKWASIKSDKLKPPRKKVITRTRTASPASAFGIGIAGLQQNVEVEETIESPEELVPFEDASKGDKVKPI